MGNYFNELRWKNIRANNLLQPKHQATTEPRPRKSPAQKRPEPNLEVRYQITASPTKTQKSCREVSDTDSLVQEASESNRFTQSSQAKKPRAYIFCCNFDLVISYVLILNTDKCSHPFINNFTK